METVVMALQHHELNGGRQEVAIFYQTSTDF